MLRAIIVEDELFVMVQGEAALKQAGCNVVGAANSPSQALEQVKEQKPEFVFMDINLNDPEYDGIELAELILRDFGIPSLFASAYIDEETRQRALLVKPIAVIQKPYTHENIRRALEDYRNS